MTFVSVAKRTKVIYRKEEGAGPPYREFSLGNFPIGGHEQPCWRYSPCGGVKQPHAGDTHEIKVTSTRFHLTSAKRSDEYSLPTYH